jgi:probable addiction module antidote protein
MKKLPPAVPIEEGLYKQLRHSEVAALYLNEAFKDGDADGILLAMHDVAKARGMSRVAETIKVHRVSLHKMLRKNGNPSLRTFLMLLREFKIHLPVAGDKPHRKAA